MIGVDTKQETKEKYLQRLKNPLQPLSSSLYLAEDPGLNKLSS